VGAISLASWLEITTLPDVYDGAPFALELVGSPDQLTAKLATGELDAALLPVNLAASLYNHTDGAVQIAAITGLGSIYGITNDPKINSFADLSDASVISFGLGATPQFAIDYLANSLPDFLVVEYASEAPEAVAQLVAGQASVGILPEPFVTSVLEQAPEFRIAFSLGDLWLEDTGSPLVSTALVFRRAWADEHPETARALIDKVRESSSFVNDNPAAAAAIVAGRDILPNIEIAQAAIPRLNLVTMTGPEMRTATLDFLATLHNFSPAAIGGDVPGDDFFFE
jgi:NitT/TauT family transport system substrate-binding protein